MGKNILNKYSDQTLWNDFRAGKPYAASAVYDRSVDSLYSYGKRFTPDESLIMDVIQDMFVYLIQKRTSLGETDNIKAYLQKTFRRRLHKAIDGGYHLVEFGGEYQELSLSVEEELIEFETLADKQAALKKVLDRLDPISKEILHYRFNEGLDYNQISEIMSITSETARQKVSRAMKTLRKDLGLKTFFYIFVTLYGMLQR
ncbi:MAG: RNA polymerase sigma factor [Mangrovibacterium sp.]